jgi:transposase InsO family protein
LDLHFKRTGGSKWRFRKTLRKKAPTTGSKAPNRIACSMSRRAHCWDNAPMECFFASLNKELVHDAHFVLRAQPRAMIVEYIEDFNNT